MMTKVLKISTNAGVIVDYIMTPVPTLSESHCFSAQP